MKIRQTTGSAMSRKLNRAFCSSVNGGTALLLNQNKKIFSLYNHTIFFKKNSLNISFFKDLTVPNISLQVDKMNSRFSLTIRWICNLTKFLSLPKKKFFLFLANSLGRTHLMNYFLNTYFELIKLVRLLDSVQLTYYNT